MSEYLLIMISQMITVVWQFCSLIHRTGERIAHEIHARKDNVEVRS